MVAEIYFFLGGGNAQSMHNHKHKCGKGLSVGSNYLLIKSNQAGSSQISSVYPTYRLIIFMNQQKHTGVVAHVTMTPYKRETVLNKRQCGNARIALAASPLRSVTVDSGSEIPKNTYLCAVVIVNNALISTCSWVLNHLVRLDNSYRTQKTMCFLRKTALYGSRKE